METVTINGISYEITIYRAETLFRDHDLWLIDMPKYGQCALIPLSQGQFAVVDIIDYFRVAEYTWSYNARKGYAQRTERIGDRTRTVYMHRFITDAPKGKEVDHKNGDGLLNVRANLRICSTAENQLNTGPRGNNLYKGVYPMKNGRWKVVVRINKQQCRIGVYDSLEEAVQVCNAKMIEAHGQFVKENPLPDEEK